MGTSRRPVKYRSRFEEERREAQRLLKKADTYAGTDLLHVSSLLEAAVAAADRSENVRLRIEARRELARVYCSNAMPGRRKHLRAARRLLREALNLTEALKVLSKHRADHRFWHETHNAILHELSCVKSTNTTLTAA